MKKNTPTAKEQPQETQTEAAPKGRNFKVTKEILVDGKNYLPGHTIALNEQKQIDSLKQSKHIK